MQIFPGVAQMVARLNGVQEAAGSTPVTRTMRRSKVRFAPTFFASIDAGRILCYPVAGS